MGLPIIARIGASALGKDKKKKQKKFLKFYSKNLHGSMEDERYGIVQPMLAK